jgi:hypothetical protein
MVSVPSTFKNTNPLNLRNKRINTTYFSQKLGHVLCIPVLWAISLHQDATCLLYLHKSGGPGSLPGQSMWDVRWTKCNWNIFYKYLGFIRLSPPFRLLFTILSFTLGTEKGAHDRQQFREVQSHTTRFVKYIFCIKWETKQAEWHINHLTPELNLSAQRCLTRFFTGDFASWTVHFVHIRVKTNKYTNYSFSCVVSSGVVSTHHATRHNTSIHNILATAPQLSISQKALGTLPEDGNVNAETCRSYHT